MLDPSGQGEVLGELALRGVDDATGVVECDGADARGPGVDGQHDGHAADPNSRLEARSTPGSLSSVSAVSSIASMVRRRRKSSMVKMCSWRAMAMTSAAQ